MVKNLPANAEVEDAGLIPRSGRSPREENGNPLKYSYLENSIDRGGWWAAVHGVAKSKTQLSHRREQILQKNNFCKVLNRLSFT